MAKGPNRRSPLKHAFWRGQVGRFRGVARGACPYLYPTGTADRRFSEERARAWERGWNFGITVGNLDEIWDLSDRKVKATMARFREQMRQEEEREEGRPWEKD